MRVEVLEPHGFCSGVKAAIDKACHALSFGGRVWCLHEIVHNAMVVEGLRAKGMRFVESLDEVPAGGTILFSAHGVPPCTRAKADARGLTVIDTTCPFVVRAHRQVRTYAEQGTPVGVVGHAEHAEVAGLVGEYLEFGPADGIKVVDSVADVPALPFPDCERIGVVCQTTLAADTLGGILSALRSRYPRLVETAASETCTATRDRQRAVRSFVRAHAQRGKVGVIAVGGAHSSNTARLAETAESDGARAWRISGPDDLASCDFSGIDSMGITSGASTPESVLAAVCGRLRAISVA